MSNIRKYKILFVHSQLVQHGSERYLYELCKSIDKNIFEVHILTRFFLVKNNYYYPLLLELNCRIHTRLLSIRHLRYPFKNYYNRHLWFRKLIKNFHASLVKMLYVNFFHKFDIISVIGIETYCDALAPLLDGKNNVFIHHVNHQFQFERNYFEECLQRKIIILDDQQKVEISNSKMSNSEFYFLPLPMSFENQLNIGYNKAYNKKFTRIAVFSRLFKDRPNEPLFKCFSEFLKLNSKSELFFYGSGDPGQYKDLLIRMGIINNVFFCGHSTSIPDSIIKDDIDILWLVSMGKSISYSSIEIAILGMPMVFWNLNEKSTADVYCETNGAINTFSNLEDFVDFNMKIIKNPSELSLIGQNIREYVLSYYDINKNIKNLENLYIGSSNIKYEY